MTTRLRQLREMGQSPWIDYITCHLIASGELQRYIARGITGLTANPTIFAQAILGSADYDAAIRSLAQAGTGYQHEGRDRHAPGGRPRTIRRGDREP